jgi:hypothetical protein
MSVSGTWLCFRQGHNGVEPWLVAHGSHAVALACRVSGHAPYPGPTPFTDPSSISIATFPPQPN